MPARCARSHSACMRADYELRLMSLANELMRANHETQLRTTYMSRELTRYQNAAAASATAVAAAKKEMHARRQDVDNMRSKLDLVMERLFTGTEAASVLQANMSAGQDHAGAGGCMRVGACVWCVCVGACVWVHACGCMHVSAPLGLPTCSLCRPCLLCRMPACAPARSPQVRAC
jgi:hypothetical protein